MAAGSRFDDEAIHRWRRSLGLSLVGHPRESASRIPSKLVWYGLRMGTKVAWVVSLVAVGLLGITAGAMLTEAVVLVPYWQSLAPTTFFEWYADHAALLVDFYSPLEVGSSAASLAAAIMFSAKALEGAPFMWVAAILSILVIGTFFAYFQGANASFADQSIGAHALADALNTWERWQWARVALGIAAFLASIVALLRHGSAET